MTRLRWISPLLCLLAGMILCVCLLFFQGWWAGQEGYVGFRVGLSLPEAEEWEHSDSHGWMGDGERLDVLHFSEETGALVEERIKSRGDLWNLGPFDDYLGDILYYGGPAKAAGWPRAPENAYWFFWERNSDREKRLTEGRPRNYTAALYDADTDTLYYLEFDL